MPRPVTGVRPTSPPLFIAGTTRITNVKKITACCVIKVIAKISFYALQFFHWLVKICSRRSRPLPGTITISRASIGLRRTRAPRRTLPLPPPPQERIEGRRPPPLDLSLTLVDTVRDKPKRDSIELVSTPSTPPSPRRRQDSASVVAEDYVIDDSGLYELEEAAIRSVIGDTEFDRAKRMAKELEQEDGAGVIQQYNITTAQEEELYNLPQIALRIINEQLKNAQDDEERESVKGVKDALLLKFPELLSD